MRTATASQIELRQTFKAAINRKRLRRALAVVIWVFVALVFYALAWIQ